MIYVAEPRINSWFVALVAVVFVVRKVDVPAAGLLIWNLMTWARNPVKLRRK